MKVDVLRGGNFVGTSLVWAFQKRGVRWGWNMKSSSWGLWMMTQELESRGDGGQEGGGVGGHTEDGVLTIPWVISQLSMGSSWSAGLSSPFTLSWINNRTTPYTREEKVAGPPPEHSTQCRERDRGEVKYARDDRHLKKRGGENGEKVHSIKMKMRKIKGGNSLK